MDKDWTGNQKAIFATLGASNHTDSERESKDFYATDPIAIDKLLKVAKPQNPIWECAAGDGALSKRLIENGFKVFSSDIVERNFKLDKQVDFLSILGFEEYDCDILTNPPYKYAKEFVIKALSLIKEGRHVYMFLKVLFLEGKARYREIFKDAPPLEIFIFSERVNCYKNNEQSDNGAAVAYAWFVWEKGYKGKPTIEWL